MKKVPLLVIVWTYFAVSASAVFAQNAPVSWTNGTFTDHSVLSLVGSPDRVTYAVNVGGPAADTENGYSFGADILSGDPTPNFSYTPSGFFLSDGFVPTAPTSLDANFNLILGSANGLNSAGSATSGITLNGLVVGQEYLVLFLVADTRNVNARTFDITSGSSTSVSQAYSFPGGTPALGGYALGTFTADATTQFFHTNASSGDGQFNAFVLATVPEPATVMLLALGLGLVAVGRWKNAGIAESNTVNGQIL